MHYEFISSIFFPLFSYGIDDRDTTNKYVHAHFFIGVLALINGQCFPSSVTSPLHIGVQPPSRS